MVICGGPRWATSVAPTKTRMIKSVYEWENRQWVKIVTVISIGTCCLSLKNNITLA